MIMIDRILPGYSAGMKLQSKHFILYLLNYGMTEGFIVGELSVTRLGITNGFSLGVFE